MPVGTAGAMKSIHWRDIRETGADIVLGNTYHLMLRPEQSALLRSGLAEVHHLERSDADRLGRLSGHVAGEVAQSH
jgi:tRNA-guanine family transglycosylase